MTNEELEQAIIAASRTSRGAPLVFIREWLMRKFGA